MPVDGSQNANHCSSDSTNNISLVKNPQVEDLVGGEGAASKNDNDEQPSPVPEGLSVQRGQTENKHRGLQKEPFPAQRLEDCGPRGISVAAIHDIVILLKRCVGINYLTESECTV